MYHPGITCDDLLCFLIADFDRELRTPSCPGEVSVNSDMEGPCQGSFALGKEIGGAIDRALASLFRGEVVAGE